MSARVPLSLRLLREHAAEVLRACEGVPEWTPYLHLLRDLLDSRTRGMKIEGAILRVQAGMAKHYADRAVTGVVRGRLETWLPVLPLTDIPCDSTIRRILRAENKRNLGGQVSHGAICAGYSSTTPTTF